jgi:predicted AlkP superfamily pyrophosphatase or phosphodiesterase
MRPLRLLAVSLFCLVCLPARTQVITVDHGPNAAAQQAKPYVVLVSLDGFRYDYARKPSQTRE